MSFYVNHSRALFPTSDGPTLFYSAPYASSPFGWSGPFGPRVLLAQKRPFSGFLDEQLLDNLFDALDDYPPSKYSRSEDSDSSDEEDNMDLEEDCDCGDDQCDCGDECDCGNELEAETEAGATIISDDKPPDATAVTKAPEKSIEIAKSEAPSVSLFKSFFSDDQNFKIDDTDDLVTVTSSWNGFNKGDLNVDFKDGSLIVSGKSEVESKDEKSGAISKSSKSVSKTIRLPDKIDKEKISAKFKDDGNLLTITVPKVKKPEKEVETIVIN
jgi:HSP20 family protein